MHSLIIVHMCAQECSRLIRFLLIALPPLLMASVAKAEVNSWTKTNSGNWEEPVWSLGVLPNSTQSVEISTTGWKAVAINPSTVQNFPASLTVSNLTIRNSFDGETTLLLNYFNDEVPLHVLDNLTVDSGGRIVNFHSGMIVGGSVNLSGTRCTQDGGTVQITNAPMSLRFAEYDLTNGVFQAGLITLAANGNGTFKQLGGTATIRELRFGVQSYAGNYELSGGNLSIEQAFLGVPYGGSQFFHTGGTNRTRSLNVGPSLYGWGGNYVLNGGRLHTSNTVVNSQPSAGAYGRFEQSGGIHWVTNSLTIAGALSSSSSYNLATYALSNGTLSARSLNVSSYGSFQQHAGTTTVAENIWFGGDWYRAGSYLRGGVLMCSNLTAGPVGADFFQTGGTLIVSNLLDFSGEPPWTSVGGYADFVFSGGRLIASNIQVSADFTITNTINGISNSGYFKLSRLLRVENATEQLGRLILGTNATIDVNGNTALLSFANSSAESWNTSATLIVKNWNGATNGNGAEQIKFGSNQVGLTSTQLGQVRFNNPVGFPAGDYGARILNTGEVVPAVGLQSALAATRDGNDLVLSWPVGWVLQTAIDVQGPYSDVEGPESSHRVAMTEAQRYFRLRQQ